MPVSNPIAAYSVYGVSIIDPSTGKPAGPAIKVLESSSLNLAGENVNLMGGALPYPWEIESGDITAELSLNFSEYPSYLTKFLLGADVTDIAASTGEVGAAEELVGESIIDLANGVSAIGVAAGSEANLKTTKYFLVAKSANTADLFAASDIDFARGIDAEFINNSQVIEENIDLSSTYINTDLGLEFTVIGTPAFVVGDSIGFDVTAENDGGYNFDVGAANSKFPEFRAIVYAEISSTGQMMELDCYRCQATGMPIGFNRKQFSNSEVTAGLKYDASRGKLFSGKSIKLK
jgi:hypothetical protein